MLGRVKAVAFVTFCVAAIAAMLSANQTAAQDVSFAGKRINVIIGTEAGGGTDGSSRLVGRFMQKYLPGQPQMVYRNMPAGNGAPAVNYFANETARDGTAWMAGDNGYIGPTTLRDSIVKYDPRQFNYIGGIMRGGNVLIMNKDKQANLTDKSKPAVVVGTPTNTRTWAEMMVWAAEALGWNIRFVIGYSSTPAMVLALRRGEIDMFGTSSLIILEPLEKSGFVVAVQSGELAKDQVLPRAAYPDVPIIKHMMEDRLTGLSAEAFDFWLKLDYIDKWFALPPKVPPEVVKTYAAAYQKAVADPEFIKAGKLQFSPDFTTQSPEEIAAIVEARSYPRDEILIEMRRLKEKHGLPGEPLTDAELAVLAAKLVKMRDLESMAITEVEREGRVVHFKADDGPHKVDVSDGRTQVTISGKKDKRASLKAGMTCRIVFPEPGGEAKSIDCM